MKPRLKSQKAAATLPPRHKWLFRAGALFLIPLLTLVVAELVLRMAGYGYPTGLFEKVQVNGAERLLSNEKFGLRFFPPELFRWPNPLMMEPVKPPGAYRIFIFGESAAQGDPEPSFGAGRYLGVLLREKYPGVNFEVVNTAITAINSHVIVPIARECAGDQGDLWIIYMGNNEMIGPFGAATVFGAKAPPWPLVRLGLALQKTRLGQLLMNLARRARGKASAPAVWGGLQMFMGNELAPNDPRKEVVYKNFDRNLRDIVRAGQKSGANIILNTVAVNLKDCPPFASLPPALAEDAYSQAESLLRQNNIAGAATNFQKACDDDALSFRADSRINGIIRAVAGKSAGPDLVLCDTAAALAEGGHIPGGETFYEHVHFNFDGNYRLALLWARAAEAFLPASVQAKAKEAAWASQQVCEAQLGLTDWNRADVLTAVRQRMEKPPLNTQPNNDQRRAALSAQIDRLLEHRDAAAVARARAIYIDAIARSPGDYMLHQNYGEFLELTGDLKQAAAEWHQATELMPRNPFAFLTEGKLLEREGDIVSARKACQQAVDLHPRYAEAWCELGRLDAAEGRLDQALDKYRKAASLQPYDAQTFVYMGKAFSLLKRTDDSVQSFHHAIELDGGNWEAHYDLGGELGMHGHFVEAKAEFEQVTNLQPQNAMGHLNLGVALLKLNDPRGARQQFSETLRLEPTNKVARSYMAAVGQ